MKLTTKGDLFTMLLCLVPSHKYPVYFLLLSQGTKSQGTPLVYMQGFLFSCSSHFFICENRKMAPTTES